MKYFRNLLITVVVILLTFSIAEAAKKKNKKKDSKATEVNVPAEKPKAPAAEPNTAPAPKANLQDEKKSDVNDANSNVVAITVNGKKITEGQINKILDAKMQQLANRIPPNMQQQYRQQMRKRVVEQLTIEEILSEKEKQKNITASQQELDEEVNKQMKTQNLTLDEFKALLKQYGTNFADFQDNMRKKIMFEKLMESEFAGKVQKSTDEQVKAFYEENKQQFMQPETIHTKHILLKPEDSNDPNQAKAKAKAQAQEILEKLKKGADFNDMAKQFSACPSAKNGGDLGSQPKGTFVPEFEKAAYALKSGQMSDVVETQFGYHIIKLVDHNDANTASLEQSKEKILQYLANKQKETLVLDYIQQIKKEADIKFTNPADNFEIEGASKPAAPARPSPDKNEPNSKK